MKRILRKAASWLFQLLVVGGALLTLFIALTPQGRAGFHTALFLTQVLDAPVKPQGWFTGEPLRHEVIYPSPEGMSVAQIYRVPDGKPRAAALLSLGVYDAGFDGAEAVNLGHALARAGYVVMYHWSPEMSLNYTIEPGKLDNMVSAFMYLEEQGYVDTERVGLGGFCVGASFALVAGADARIRDRVHFVNAFGPYFDAETFLVQATSRSVVYEGERMPWDPDQPSVDEGDSFEVAAVIVSPDIDCPVDFEFDIRLGSGLPTGARPYVSGIPSLVSFKRCDKNLPTSVSTSDMEATAELWFALGPTSTLDSRIAVDGDIATAIIIDGGGATEAFETLIDAGNTQTNGISSDGTTMWTADLGGQKLYAYNLATKARDAAKDLDSLDVGNGAPDGIWTNGTTVWVADGTADKIFAYDITTKERNADEDFYTLGAAGNGGPEGIWSDGTTMWVADGLADKLYAYDMATKEWDSDKDFDTLAVAGNNLPAGIWSDRTTMWVADWEGDKIYAYNMATKERDAGKDFNALTATGNNNPLGIWSDGTIMWVADWEDDKIYAYYFPEEPEEPVLPTIVRRPSPITTGVTPETDDIEPPPASVIKPDLCVADIVDPDGGEIELGDTIADSWVGGCPSITRGGRLAKYYTFNLPSPPLSKLPWTRTWTPTWCSAAAASRTTWSSRTTTTAPATTP